MWPFGRNAKKPLVSEVFYVFLGIILTTAVLAAACAWKYGLFAYNGIDLAYFSQVFWNTVHGRPFQQSIHPHLSLGDHAELAILLLAPLYALWQDPRCLLLLQAIALALPAWPLWKIAVHRNSPHGRFFALAPLLMAGAWLLNPLVHNVALFEFHMLPFALAPLMMAMLAYEEGKKAQFIAWTTAALLVREDVALVVIMIGVLAWMERKTLWWKIAPVVMGAGWFMAAMALIARFSPDGGYKYRIYYEWLGATPTQMLVNAVTDPLRVIAHVVTLPNLEMGIGFLMPFAFLPLLRPRRLMLALGPLAQILLGAPGGGEIVLQTHYATLFLPALALAASDGLMAAPALIARHGRIVTRQESIVAAAALLFIASSYGAAVMGPLPSVAASLGDREARRRAAAAQKAVDDVPADAAVAAGYALLPALSSRTNLTSLHYVFLGVTQFGAGTYVPPTGDVTVVADAADFLTYHAQFSVTAWAAPHAPGGLRRFMSYAGGWTALHPPFALYDPAVKAPVRGHEGSMDGEDVLAEASAHVTRDGDVRTLVTVARWRIRERAPGLVARMTATLGDGKTLRHSQAVASPPPFTLMTSDGAVTVLMARLLPDEPDPQLVEVELLDETSSLMLDGLRSAARHVTSSRRLGGGTIRIK